MSVNGKIHSIQSLGTVDGPGIRFVAFLSGCNLRCSCCHNPDTWRCNEGHEESALSLVEKAEKYRAYFGKNGGITLSGGEPLLQPEFVKEVFCLCKQKNINTCLDTYGPPLTESIKGALSFCDKVLLDLKYTTEEFYFKYTKGSLKTTLEFLRFLNNHGISTTIRQVVIPTINFDDENFERLYQIVKDYPCVDKIELLPFKKICEQKYETLKIEFPFKDIPEADPVLVKNAEKALNEKLKQK